MTAVRLTKLDSDNLPVGNINFDRKEVMRSEVRSNQKSVSLDSQSGNPTLMILSDEYMSVPITFLSFGTATENKFTELRNFIKAGGIVRVYPKFIAAPTVYYDCHIVPASIPVAFGFSGESRGGVPVNLVFKETIQESQYVVSEEITIE